MAAAAFATMIDHIIRRLGGTIQGGLPGRTQCKLAIEGGLPPNKAMLHLELLLTVRRCPNLHTLHDLWGECKFGIGGRKAASQFIGQEHSGHGVNEKVQRCCHRKRMFDLMERLVHEGGAVDSAIAKIKVAHGQRASPIFIMNVVGNHGVHPALLQRDSQPAVNVFFAPRSVVRGGRTDAGVPRGGARGNHVPRPMDGSASVQGTLSAAISGLGAGNLMAVFQSTGVTANVQKASMQNWQLANCMQKQQFLLFYLVSFCICSAPLLLRWWCC